MGNGAAVRVGAWYQGTAICEFSVWAPLPKRVTVKMVTPRESLIPMTKLDNGYWAVTVKEVPPGSRYAFVLDDQLTRPDPASHFQPAGVHEPSQTVNHGDFAWTDSGWSGVPLEEMILYELHVGTFTSEGSFDAIIPRLEALQDVGVNALEIMPVSQFPGERNWGYDGVFPFAVQNSYGGPDGLKRLVNACHRRGMAVVLDVVYNHLGPEGNYLADFAPYFTAKYQTPWGKAVNFDDAHSDEVRNYFIENALFWFEHYHFDALRLDAIHAICDMSAKPFLQELAEKTDSFSSLKNRGFYLIAESDLNDVRVITPRNQGGYGIDAQWSDDYHHALHTLLTGETSGYYADFGGTEQLAKALRDGFVYSWQYSPYRRRSHGSCSAHCPANQFIVFAQNHDQVGNRLRGDRLSRLVSLEALKLAAAAVILAPCVPLLFMGEEYGEVAPFLYFVSHSDPELIAAVRKGRAEEFQAFDWQGEVPDPQSEDTFSQCKLQWHRRDSGKHKVLLDFYRHLIHLRKEIPALNHLERANMQVSVIEEEKLVVVHRWYGSTQVLAVMNFNSVAVNCRGVFPPGEWVKLLDSAAEHWNGPGFSLPRVVGSGEAVTIAETSFALYEYHPEPDRAWPKGIGTG
jgi:maltooligosyltrehalose trehalohydrolase